MYVELLGFALLTVTVSFLEENGHGLHGLHLNSTWEEVFSSPLSLKKYVGAALAEMVEAENTNLLLGKKGDIKYDLLSATSENYTIHPFGSRVMGLGLKSSDLDILVDVGNCYELGGDTNADDRCVNAVEHIADSLRAQNRSFYFLRLIPKVRVPLLKVVHKNTGIHVDISTRNGLAIENSLLVRNYMKDQRVRFVCAATKVWAQSQGLAKSVVGLGGFSSYAMLWLTLFALLNDNPPAVTSAAQLKKEYPGPPHAIDGWDCGHCRSPHPKSKNNKTEIELLHHFFSFYSKMSLRDFRENVICTSTGTLIPRTQFADTDSLPSEFSNYKQQVTLDSSMYQMHCNTSLCIQDPVEQGHNIAKTVEDWAILRFFNASSIMAKIMDPTNNSFKQDDRVK